MSTQPSIHKLRELIKRDEEFFKTQSQRLTEIQNSAPEDLSRADRNTLQNWDKSVVRDCNRQLEELEKLEYPSAEQREIMQELNKLIAVGDHIIERRNLMQDELHAKLAALELSETPTTSPENEAKETAGEQEVPQSSAAGSQSTSTKSASAPNTDFPVVNKEQYAKTEQGKHAQSDKDKPAFDPKILYAVLKVDTNASLAEVKKAAKKATILLHPDRNLGDPGAASRFANLQSACRVFESEETRKEFDDTGDVKQFEDLGTALKALTAKE